MKNANYVIDLSKSTQEILRIVDLGPWDICRTVTNDAENVVRELARNGELPEGRRLIYKDSTGEIDEIVVRGGEFIEFKILEKV